MFKLRPILFLILPIMVVMSSCLKGDLEDLEKQLAELEKALGSNEPIVFNMTTTDNADQAFIKNATFLFKESNWDNYFTDYGDGNYYIFVQRSLDLDWYNYSRIRFSYNATTKEVTDVNYRVEFDDPGYYYYSNIYDYETGVTFDIKVNSFDPAKGKISFTVNIETDETATDNWFSGNPMSITTSFNGTLANYPD